MGVEEEEVGLMAEPPHPARMRMPAMNKPKDRPTKALNLIKSLSFLII
jgi:hypothetical protein